MPNIKEKTSISVRLKPVGGFNISFKLIIRETLKMIIVF
jgi:hypothetical protein